MRARPGAGRGIDGDGAAVRWPMSSGAVQARLGCHVAANRSRETDARRDSRPKGAGQAVYEGVVRGGVEPPTPRFSEPLVGVRAWPLPSIPAAQSHDHVRRHPSASAKICAVGCQLGCQADGPSRGRIGLYARCRSPRATRRVVFLYVPPRRPGGAAGVSSSRSMRRFLGTSSLATLSATSASATLPLPEQPPRGSRRAPHSHLARPLPAAALLRRQSCPPTAAPLPRRWRSSLCLARAVRRPCPVG